MQERAAKIKLLILDVDGVLTDGCLYYNSTGELMQSFYVQDGLGLKFLANLGIKLAIITGRHSKVAEARATELGIDHFYQGRINKLEALKELQANVQVELSEIAYMGDDVIDLPILSRVGLAACPRNAHSLILGDVHFVSRYDGGKGAVRELCDLILGAQNKLESIVVGARERGELFHAK